MPVTPNIQILRVLDRWPFSTRSRDERRLRSQRSVPQLRPRTSPPTGPQPCQTIYLGETAVTVVDHDSSDLNIQSQQSLCLVPDPPQSPLHRLRHKTSKWFADKRAAKGMSTIQVPSGSSIPTSKPSVNEAQTLCLLILLQLSSYLCQGKRTRRRLFVRQSKPKPKPEMKPRDAPKPQRRPRQSTSMALRNTSRTAPTLPLLWELVPNG